jgi:predicted dehydrogenase
MKHFLVLLLLPTLLHAQPVRLAVAGLSHGHNGWILGRQNDEVAELVGIWEPDIKLANRLRDQYHLDPKLFHTSLQEMLTSLKPEGILCYGSSDQHLPIIRICIPKGIPVMVEKPLAFSEKEAEDIAALSKKHGVPVLTNFETAWYPTSDKSLEITRDTMFMGRIRKVVVHDGHQGPREINVPDYFFNWLTDPVRNGGGALIDFGCYGANLMTALMKGQAPNSVTAVTQHLKRDIYPRVDDEATIILTYPTAQCIIQASWNWPFGRKDMEIYGESGYAITKDASHMRIKSKSGNESSLDLTPEDTHTLTSPFPYFAGVIRGTIKVPDYGYYSLENNVIVARILDAARKSAREGRTVFLK